MSVESKQERPPGLLLCALCWLIGAENEALAVRLGFVLVVALLGGLAAVLLVELPLFIFGILAAAMGVSFRIAVPVVLHFVPVPALDWQRVPVPGEGSQHGKDGLMVVSEEAVTQIRNTVDSILDHLLNGEDPPINCEWVTALPKHRSNRFASELRAALETVYFAQSVGGTLPEASVAAWKTVLIVLLKWRATAEVYSNADLAARLVHTR